jgi:hypothetical protein
MQYIACTNKHLFCFSKNCLSITAVTKVTFGDKIYGEIGYVCYVFKLTL